MKRAFPFLALLVVGCGGTNTGAPTPGLYSDTARSTREREEMVANASKSITKGEAAKVVLATNEFGARLLGEIGTGKNVLISPVSVATALTIAMNGASGTTLDEMKKALGVERISMEQINAAHASLRTLLGDEQLRIANSIWSRKGVLFEESFMKDNTAFFNAKIADLDFNAPESSGIINDWVKTATDGKIAEIVPKVIANDVVMYIINAVSFDAKWKEPFDKEGTSPAKFAISDAKQVDAQMMHRTARTQNGISKEGDLWVKLPYAGDRFELIAVMPKAGRSFVRAFSKIAVVAGTPGITEQVSLSFPKFKLNHESAMVPLLKKLGIKEAFTDQANFSRLRSKKDVMVTDVKHKTFIDVTEEGTKAAAVTAVEVGVTSAPMNKEIKFNRPFAYAIRETKSGQIILLGVLADPTAN